MNTEVFNYMNKSYCHPDISLALAMGLTGYDLDLLGQLKQGFGKFFNQTVIHDGVTYYWVDAGTLVSMCRLFGYNTPQSVLLHLNVLCGCVVNGKPSEGFTVEDYPLMKYTTMYTSGTSIPRKRSYYAIRTSVVGKFIKDISLFPYIDFLGGFQAPSEEIDDTLQEQEEHAPVDTGVIIDPTTIDFIDKVLSINPSTFSKPRIDVNNPSKSLVKLQEVLQAIQNNQFMELYGKSLPKSVQGVIVENITTEDLLQFMGGFKGSGRKIGILDYFLSYNMASKKYHSIFVSYLAKRGGNKEVSASVPTRSGSISPKVKEWLERKKQRGDYTKVLQVVAEENILKVASVIYEWYEDNKDFMANRVGGMHGLNVWHNVVNRMADFVVDGHVEKINRTPEEFFKVIQPFNTANKEWLMFARWVRHYLGGPILSSKNSDKYIDNDTGSWNYINYRELISDID